MKPVVKGAYRIDIAHRVPEYISIAFREALAGKRGPIYLDLPGDILAQRVNEEKVHWPENYRVESRPAGDPALIERAIEMLRGAERPIIVTGSGILWSQASNELQRFVLSTGIPFFLSLIHI